ncbi:MAG: ComF family protein [Magnetococcales bacterium]|nr:ComF family protein [Magnetococcales bacterium]
MTQSGGTTEEPMPGSLLPGLKRLGGRLLDALYPPICPLCKTPIPHHPGLCDTCMETLPDAPRHLCQGCGAVTMEPLTSCTECPEMGTPADAVYSAFWYQSPLDNMMLRYKFGDRTEWAPLLAALMWSQLEVSFTQENPHLIIPIPLHYRRLVARRYNQAALLARSLAHQMDCPLSTNSLKRIRMTTPQTELYSDERRRNLHGAFRAEPRRIAGRRILLVDDVLTTGSTMHEAVAVLKEAGAERVIIATLLRTKTPAAQPRGLYEA